MRSPAIAGLFYPDDAVQLRQWLNAFFKNTKRTEKNAFAIVSPHAGYIYSGQTAAFAFSALANIELAVILGPNHTGLGKSLALSLEDWETPLGIIENETSIGKQLLQDCPSLQHDELAHLKEHSIEVQLPFIQYLNPNARIIPICMGDQSIETAKALANSLHKILPKNATIIASSDFSHYVPLQIAEREDKKAIKLICNLDVEEFYKERKERHWSICGYGAIATAMLFSKLREGKGRLIYYDTSATASHDPWQVVGYGAIAFSYNNI